MRDLHGVFLLYDEAEKSLVCGGLLMSVGIGNLFGFWVGVIAGGSMLFGVALLVVCVGLLGGRG